MKKFYIYLIPLAACALTPESAAFDPFDEEGDYGTPYTTGLRLSSPDFNDSINHDNDPAAAGPDLSSAFLHTLFFIMSPVLVTAVVIIGFECYSRHDALLCKLKTRRGKLCASSSAVCLALKKLKGIGTKIRRGADSDAMADPRNAVTDAEGTGMRHDVEEVTIDLDEHSHNPVRNRQDPDRDGCV